MNGHVIYELKYSKQDNATVAAIKCIKKNVLDGERELLRVKSEFSCWRALSGHPNVIRLIAFLETESHWCFVMEYIDLGSLSQVLRSNGDQILFLTFLCSRSDRFVYLVLFR